MSVRELRLEVDENDLVNEWKGQAQLMLDYGIKLADARTAEDHLRAALSVAKAKLDNEIRTDPGDFKIDKITEAVVSATIATQPEYLKAEKAVLEAAHNVRLLAATVDAIGHRKSTLQGLTDLFNKQWFADPRNPGQPEELRKAANGGGTPPTKTIKGRVARRAAENED